MSRIRTSPKLILFAAVVSLMAVGAGCKSKKKAMEVTDTSAADKARAEQEAALKKQREEEERRAAEERAKREEEDRKRAPYAKLEQYFSSISNASSSAAANNSIVEALTLFSSGEVPVLIVISESGGQKDYDRPTNITNYLNYLKDQKKQADKIGNLQFDAAGKITEVELIKGK